MAKTIVGLYDEFSTAQTVVQDLINAGFDRSNISIMASDADGRHKHILGDDESDAGSAAATGAASGAVVGGVGGLLLGLGALAIPGFGPIVAAGPIISALTGAGLGAAAGGVIGALTGLGVSDEDAEYYAEGVRRGGTLVTVRTDDDHADKAMDIMDNYGAVNIRERAGAWKEEGWSKSGSGSNTGNFSEEQRQKPVTAGSAPAGVLGNEGRYGSGYERYRSIFMQKYEKTYATSGTAFDAYEPAYRYGHDIAGDNRYEGKNWDSIEPELRRDWETKNYGPWDRFKDAVRDGYHTVKDELRDGYNDTKDAIRRNT